MCVFEVKKHGKKTVLRPVMPCRSNITHNGMKYFLKEGGRGVDYAHQLFDVPTALILYNPQNYTCKIMQSDLHRE